MTPPPPSDYVSFDLFKWIIGSIYVCLGGLGGLVLRALGIKALFTAHVKEDTEMFAEFRAQLGLEHSENKATMKDMESRLLHGQMEVLTEMREDRRFFRDFLLRRFGE